MADLSQQLNDLEVRLQKAFREKDWDEFMALDSSLQEVLSGYKAIEEFPPQEQLQRIQAHYQTMRSYCMKRRLHLSQKMEKMRQKKSALNAYGQCLHAGNLAAGKGF